MPPPRPGDAGVVPSRRRRAAGDVLLGSGAALLAAVALLSVSSALTPATGVAAAPAAARLAAAPAALPAPVMGPVVPAAARVVGPPTGVRPHAGAAVSAAPVADPVALSIPAIDLRTTIEPRGADSTGAMQIPKRFDISAWYQPGPAPGERGAAVIVGHVDSRRGPAVFFRLRELSPGDEVLVRRADGTTARFAVDRTETYAKDRFPTSSVFGVDGRELRLITCSGRFNRMRGHYPDNLVVFARLIDPSA